jgi:hypothetical protein
MDGKVRSLPLALVISVLGAVRGGAAGGEPASESEAFVARLVHPDRQAAEVLRLFEGARWRDPAAALAGWKQQKPDAGLGKPIEAVIALFNSEMAQEWRSFDHAEIRIGLEPANGALGWFALIPRDDGTVAAGVTAMRLTYPDDRPLAVDGREVPVARLGRSGFPLACQVGTAIILASSRDRLERGIAIARAGRDSTAPDSSRPSGLAGLRGDLDSGTLFRLEPGGIPIPPGAPLAQRRTIEALEALGCRRVEGAAFLKDGSLVLDVSTTLAGPGPEAKPPRPHAVEMAWLEALPSEGVVAMVSLVINPDPASWDFAFAAADRIERVDAARAQVAPIRSRLNLLAMGTGLKLEADIRPHLRGLSACLFGEPTRAGRSTGGLIVLHLDEPAIAARIVQHATSRLGTLVGADATSRAVSLHSQERDVWIAWGDGARASSHDARPGRSRSLAALCGAWAAEGCRPPVRLGAFWPARLWRPDGMTEATIIALSDDPPIIWWGWSEPGREHDLLRWTGLGDRVRRVLGTRPGDSGADRHGRDSGLRFQESKSSKTAERRPDNRQPGGPRLFGCE